MAMARRSCARSRISADAPMRWAGTGCRRSVRRRSARRGTATFRGRWIAHDIDRVVQRIRRCGQALPGRRARRRGDGDRRPSDRSVLLAAHQSSHRCVRRLDREPRALRADGARGDPPARSATTGWSAFASSSTRAPRTASTSTSACGSRGFSSARAISTSSTPSSAAWTPTSRWPSTTCPACRSRWRRSCRRRALQARGDAAGFPRRAHPGHRHGALRDRRRAAGHGGDDAGAHGRSAHRQQADARRGGAHPALCRRVLLHVARRLPACTIRPPGGRKLPQIIERCRRAGAPGRRRGRRPGRAGSGAGQCGARPFGGAVRGGRPAGRPDAERRARDVASRPDRHRRLADRGAGTAGCRGSAQPLRGSGGRAAGAARML